MLGKTIDELLYGMSKEELIEWMAFYTLEPWGSRVEDDRFGIMASTFVNVMSSGRRYKVSDFFPSRNPKERTKVEAEKVKNILSQLA